MELINDMRAAVTLVSFIVFVAICIWAYSGKRKAGFEEAARTPLRDDEDEGKAATGSAR